MGGEREGWAVAGSRKIPAFCYHRLIEFRNLHSDEEYPEEEAVFCGGFINFMSVFALDIGSSLAKRRLLATVRLTLDFLYNCIGCGQTTKHPLRKDSNTDERIDLINKIDNKWFKCKAEQVVNIQLAKKMQVTGEHQKSCS